MLTATAHFYFHQRNQLIEIPLNLINDDLCRYFLNAPDNAIVEIYDETRPILISRDRLLPNLRYRVICRLPPIIAPPTPITPRLPIVANNCRQRRPHRLMKNE